MYKAYFLFHCNADISFQVSLINGHLLTFSSDIPNMFGRKPRSLSQVERWKATEFRLFLLYLGPIVLRPHLSTELYDHFLHLHIAISILVDSELIAEYLDYANECLTYFVRMVPVLYSPQYMVYNTHSLLHLTEDVRRFGSLDTFSAFRFENEMSHLRQLTRSGKHVVVQIAKRLSESRGMSHHHSARENCVKPKDAFLLDGGFGVVIEKVYGNFCDVSMYKCEPLFTEPCDSSLISSYKSSRNRCRVRQIQSEVLIKRCICLDDGNRRYFLKLRHC